MEINFKSRQRVKAFFKEGKPSLILKLNLPVAESENELFNSRFNSFYEAIYDTYIRVCEAYSEKIERPERPISFTVETAQKETPVGAVSIFRTSKLRLPTGEVRRGEYLDIFDSETGLLMKEKRKLKFTRKKR